MDGHAAESDLISPVDVGDMRFAVATPADDPDVRRLLRENPMSGAVSISLEREPDASRAAAIEGDVHRTIVARESAGGPIVAMGSVAVRSRYVNGIPTRVGYLGQLRVDANYRRRRSIVRGGYTFLHALLPTLGAQLYFTSIAADNAVARRLLERGLPGMPTYRPLCELVTIVFRRGSRGAGGSPRPGSPQLMSAVHALLSEANAGRQLAPAWTRAELESLPARHVRVAFERGRPSACAALWDQRGFKQAVVRGYPPVLRVARIPLNLVARLTRFPHLPPIGQPLSQAFVSHVATPPDRPELIEPLIRSLHGSADALGVDCFAIGFDARDARLAIVRRAFGGREYRTRLYLVHWPDGAAAADAVDQARIVAPEVALL